MSNGVVIQATGNVTKDPELRFSAAGRPWATFSIAVNEIGRSASGERTENVTFLNCKIFGESAENLVESAPKGTRVSVEGKLRNEKWKDAEGNDRTSMSVYVDEVSVSVRWATANVTKKPSANGGGAPREFATTAARPASNGGDFASDAGGFEEENPFL